MSAPNPLTGPNPFNLTTGQTMYQTRQFFVGSPYVPTGARGVFGGGVVGTPGALAGLSSTQTASALVNSLEEEADFFGLLTQTITVAGAPTGGQFQLGYDGIPTVFLQYNATALQLTTAINQLVGAGLVAPTGSKFNAVQSVTLGGTITGGTFTLTALGQTTAAIPYNATAAQVQTALANLQAVGTQDVTVTGSAGGPYTVTFVGALGWQPIATMTASNAGLTGTSPTVTPASVTTGVTPTYGINASGSAGGPWTVTFGAGYTGTPVMLIAVRNLQLTGGTNPHVVVTSTAQQQGIEPF